MAYRVTVGIALILYSVNSNISWVLSTSGLEFISTIGTDRTTIVGNQIWHRVTVRIEIILYSVHSNIPWELSANDPWIGDIGARIPQL
jgi:hypothetical protein